MGIVVRQSFLNLISIGIAFLIGAVNTLYLYPTFLGSKLQGLIIALLAISNLLQPFISFGTQHAVIRYYSKYTKKTDKDGLLTLSIIIPLVIVILFAPIFYAYYDEIRQFLFQNDQSLSQYAYVILFVAVSTSFFEVFYSWLRVKLKSVFGNFLKELYPRLLISFLLISYSYGVLDFENFVLFLIYGYYLRLLIIIIYSFYINKPRISLSFKSDFKEVFKYCLLIFLSGAASSIILDIDKSMLSSILTVENVAYYSVAVFIAAVIEIPGRAMFQILSPVVADAINKKHFKKLEGLLKKSSTNLVLVASLFFLLINLNLDDFYEMLNQDGYSIGIPIVIIVSFGKLYSMSIGCINNIISNSKYYYYTFWFSLFSSVLAVVLNIYLITDYGIVGAAYATLIVIIIMNSLKLYLIKVKFNIHPYSKDTVKIIVLSIIGFVIFSNLKLDFQPVLNIIIKSSLILILYTLSAYIFRLSDDVNIFIDKFNKNW
ncbi:MAG: oligosaccharide flippase family protein [Cryomorphaceae bacterium]|nr:oligosaccharide flippase family protein [Cryomorphaceae bacterium]MBT4236617.1 oligosaccharide flippase family protein [Cryomorphaceae bacterium]MBT4813813.1 oligosaccharide flippase family protein [Cryomorphaceae bacterium]MBT5416361.1 oligosaccharide flippase family protein [Cryomorphaceae bacterium]MBT6223932.1 oligosaccharide flippase family protein [Cryomorphaceae bacterium]